MLRTLFAVLAVCVSINVCAQGNHIDTIRHDAPELAHFGEYDIGVRTLVLTDRIRPDVLNTVEVWYPALLAIASHGYPGNRYLMDNLGENLASKAYVVAAIDHRDSTCENKQAVASARYNRPLDQLFILDQMARLSNDESSFLSGMADAEHTGVFGYSMGGYELINNIGGGFSDLLVTHEEAPVNELAFCHAAANPDFRQNFDPGIKAGFAVAPWGMAAGVWNPDDLQGIEVPSFCLAGSVDVTAGYEDGARAIYENAIKGDRYLLTYVNAGHHAGAPIPAPTEILSSDDQSGASHCTDPVWNSVRMNNIMDHFATAFFDYQLKGKKKRQAYLSLVPDSQDGVYSVENEQETDAHTYWKGFAKDTARGLLLEHLGPVE
jgi:predicted dienelactone hydrolase